MYKCSLHFPAGWQLLAERDDVYSAYIIIACMCTLQSGEFRSKASLAVSSLHTDFIKPYICSYRPNNVCIYMYIYNVHVYMCKVPLVIHEN